MRWVSYLSPTGPRLGAVVGSADQPQVVDAATAADSSIPTTLKGLLELGPDAMVRAWNACQHGVPQTLSKLQLLPPVLAPQKILCVGLNYADHAAETGSQVGKEPVIFSKFPTCLRGSGQPIELPPESAQVDYEAELVVVIGATARRVSQVDARRHIAGYCCGHDVSARDWQKHKPGGQWLLGKSFDSFAPLGPWMATPDEVADPENLKIQFRLNGQLMQDSSTSQLIFRIEFLVSYLSHVCTLLPGDLIFTGTPPGVGVARKPPVFLQPGDIAEVTIEGLGTLRNPVIAASSAAGR